MSINKTTGNCSYRLPRDVLPSATYMTDFDLQDFSRFLSRYIPGIHCQYLVMMEKRYFTIGFDHAVNIEQVMVLTEFYTNGWMKWRIGLDEYLQSHLGGIQPLIDIVASYLEPELYPCKKRKKTE